MEKETSMYQNNVVHTRLYSHILYCYFYWTCFNRGVLGKEFKRICRDVEEICAKKFVHPKQRFEMAKFPFYVFMSNLFVWRAIGTLGFQIYSLSLSFQRHFHLENLAFALAALERNVGFNLKWLMRFCQTPALYRHCSMSVQQPGKPGRHSVAPNNFPGGKIKLNSQHQLLVNGIVFWLLTVKCYVKIFTCSGHEAQHKLLEA